MAENVVLVRFEEPSKTYEALSILKKCNAEGRIELGVGGGRRAHTGGSAPHPGEH